jgi:hypothetical protein
MAELLKTKEAELTTADPASYGITAKPPDGPKLVKGQEPETLDRVAAVSEPMPLFSESEMGEFRSRWSKIQTAFVDEPHRTGRRRRQVGSCGDAATRGGFRQGAVGLGKAVGPRRQRVHGGPSGCPAALSFLF